MQGFIPGLKTIGKISWLFLLSFPLFGCATTQTEISSKRGEEARNPVDSMVVVSHLAKGNESWAGTFETTLVREMKKTGLRAKVQTVSPGAGESEKARYTAELKAFDPATILVVKLLGGTKNQYGDIMEERFDATLFRNARRKTDRKVLWNARITLKPGGSQMSGSAYGVLARDLVNQLRADQVIR